MNTDTRRSAPTDNRADTLPDATPPVAGPAAASTPQPPTGHYGAGYGDPTPVVAARPDGVPTDDPSQAYAEWRTARLRQFDEDYAAWQQTGAPQFPPDFDAWRRTRHELLAEQSAAGLPLAAAGEDAPESVKAALLLERS